MSKQHQLQRALLSALQASAAPPREAPMLQSLQPREAAVALHPARLCLSWQMRLVFFRHVEMGTSTVAAVKRFL